MSIQTHQFDPPSGPLPSYLDRLNRLIRCALDERAQVEKYGDTMERTVGCNWTSFKPVSLSAMTGRIGRVSWINL